MRSLLSHFSHIAWWWCEFVFHWADFHFFIKRSFSYKILLVDFADGLSSVKSSHIWSASSFLTIDVEIFSFDFMVFISFLFTLKGNSLLINLSLGKDTGLYVNLFLGSWVQIHLYCIVSFFRIFTTFLVSVEIVCIV